MPAIDQTPDDASCVKLYVMLPLLLTAFERDKKVAVAAFKTPGPYVDLIDEAIKRVEADLKEVRIKMRQLGLKVYEEQLTSKGIEAKYLCRGYQHQFGMLTSFLAAESAVLMEKYLGIDIATKYIARYDQRPPNFGKTKIEDPFKI
ncbi:hypothetical protein D3C87_1103740 [compost metagenome]